MSLSLIDRLHPDLRSKLQTAIDEGQLRQLDALALLEPEHLLPLARFSLLLLVAGGLSFGALNTAASLWQRHATGGWRGGWGLLTWMVINIVGYLVILPI